MSFCRLLCKEETLDPKKVKGKIVVCLRGENARVAKGQEAARAGAAGMILCNDELSGNEIIADPHVLPATHINYTDGLIVYAYINTTKYAVLSLHLTVCCRKMLCFFTNTLLSLAIHKG